VALGRIRPVPGTVETQYEPAFFIGWLAAFSQSVRAFDAVSR
jgi:hypothetical protein